MQRPNELEPTSLTVVNAVNARRKVILPKLDELSKSIQTKVRSSLIVEQFARFLKLDLTIPKFNKDSSSWFDTQYQELLKHLAGKYPVEMAYTFELFKDDDNNYVSRHAVSGNSPVIAKDLMMAEHYLTALRKDFFTLLEGNANFDPVSLYQPIFIGMVACLYVERYFSGKPHADNTYEKIRELYKCSDLLGTLKAVPEIESHIFLLAYCNLQFIPQEISEVCAPRRMKLQEIRKHYNTVFGDFEFALSLLSPYSQALFCYHIANFCEIHNNFSETILNSSPDDKKTEYLIRMRTYAAKVADENTRKILELLSFNRPIKHTKRNASKLDAFRIWFLQTKRDFYGLKIMERLQALKNTVIENKWQSNADNYFIDVLPDARHLVGFVLHIWQRQLTDNIICINEHIKLYQDASTDPNHKLFSLYVAILTWKKDCIEAIREILKIRSIYYSCVLKVNTESFETEYTDWLYKVQEQLNCVVLDVNSKLTTLGELKSANRINEGASLKKYHQLLRQAMAQSPKQRHYVHMQSKRSKFHFEDEAEDVNTLQTSSEVEAKDAFAIGYEMLCAQDYIGAKEHYLREANAAGDKLVHQAKLFYHLAEVIELEIDAICQQQASEKGNSKITQLRDQAIDYFKRARTNLLCQQFEIKSDEIETWLELVNTKLEGVEDQSFLPTFDEEAIEPDHQSLQPAATSDHAKVAAKEMPTKPKSEYFLQSSTLKDLLSSESNNCKLWYEAIHRILNIFRKHKIKYVIPGGVIRDKLLGFDFYDVDISVFSNSLEKVASLFPGSKIVGKKHPVLLVESGVKLFEISLVSTDQIGNYDLEEDTAKRFLRMDSLVYVPEERAILDFHQGYRDINEKTIRLLSEGKQRLINNPINILRVIRHAAKYGFEIESGILELMPTCRKKLATDPEDNAFTEMYKTVTRGYCLPAILILKQHELLDLFFPGLTAALDNRSASSFTHFINSALEYYDSRMKTMHRSGLLSSLSVQFCFTILLWPHFHKKQASIKLPNASKESLTWYQEFSACIDAVIKESILGRAMPFYIQNYIRSIWTLFYSEQYKLPLSGPRLNHIYLRDVDVFRDFYNLAQKSVKDQPLAVNPAKTAVGFHQRPAQQLADLLNQMNIRHAFVEQASDSSQKLGN